MNWRCAVKVDAQPGTAIRTLPASQGDGTEGLKNGAIKVPAEPVGNGGKRMGPIKTENIPQGRRASSGEVVVK